MRYSGASGQTNGTAKSVPVTSREVVELHVFVAPSVTSDALHGGQSIQQHCDPSSRVNVDERILCPSEHRLSRRMGDGRIKDVKGMDVRWVGDHWLT